MKIRDIINQDRPTLSFEVFPPKKDTDFADVEAAACSIAAYKPDYMSVTYHKTCKGNTGKVQCANHCSSYLRMCRQRDHKKGTHRDEGCRN